MSRTLLFLALGVIALHSAYACPSPPPPPPKPADDGAAEGDGEMADTGDKGDSDGLTKKDSPCGYGYGECTCTAVDAEPLRAVDAPKIGECPRPLSRWPGHVLRDQCTKNPEDLRACNRDDLRFPKLSFRQYSELCESTLIEHSAGDPAKMANLVEVAQADQIDKVEWEWIAPNMTAEELNAMSEDAVGKLPLDRILPYMSEYQRKRLNMDHMLNGMSESSAENMQWSIIGRDLTPSQVEQIKPETLEKLGPVAGTREDDLVPWDEVVPHMSNEAIEAVSVEQFQALPSSAYSGLDCRTFKHVNPEVMADLSTEQMQLVREDLWQDLTKEQAKRIEPSKFGELPVSSLQYMNPDALSVLPPEAFESMGPSKFGALRPEQLRAINPDTMQALKPELFRSVSSSKLADAGLNLEAFQYPVLDKAIDGAGFGNERRRR